MSREIAILMAAGLGSRMKPLTDTTAKPLVAVNGTPLIETVLSALDRRGVSDIYVVVGYKKEQFSELVPRHPNVHLIENPEFATKNNINSIAVAAREMASADCFVCEADLFLPDSNVLCRDLRHSGYFGRMVEGGSDDWIFETDTDRRILAIHKGGVDCYNMVGISFFKQADAARIATAVADRVQDGDWAQKFWDDVVDELVKQDLDLVVHEVQNGEIVECDTIEDLMQLEASLK